MKLRNSSVLAISLFATGTVLAQTQPLPPPPTASATPRASDQLAKALENRNYAEPTSRELREQAYAKLLEGQRHFWSGERLRSRAGRQNSVRMAREAFQRSVELDPGLSEGYTALAELAVNSQTQDADEAIRLALLAVKVNPNNFGARRLLGRLYSFQSKLVNGPFNAEAGSKAIAEWQQVARLDPRNAEAWALLAELYEKSGKSEESINALKKWLASATPVDSRFYQMLTGGQQLAPENAALKLGSALLKAGRTKEAVETISVLVADEPENSAAVELLGEAVTNAEPAEASVAVEALRQAVYANPGNSALINILAQVYARSGNIDDAATLLRGTAERVVTSDRPAAASYQIALGDIYARSDRLSDAIAAYDAAFVAYGIVAGDTLDEDEREFAMHVFEKMIRVLKNADRRQEARAVIDRAGAMLGKDDLFVDRQLISFYREAGERGKALEAVRAARRKSPDDQGFLRQEATLLAETGKVDEAVALIRKAMQSRATPAPVSIPPTGNSTESIAIAVPQSDAFSDHLFISNLYSEAGRGKEAIAAANEAYAVARGAERKQIARLTLATAQQMSGDVKGAETTLRELLKETPGNPIAMNNLGYFLLERNERIEEAFGLIEQAVKIDPTNPSYLDSLGWAYFKLGKLAEAEKNLKEALRYDSSSGTIHEHLGDVYQKQGRADLAKSSWLRAESLFSDAADIARVKKKLATGK